MSMEPDSMTPNNNSFTDIKTNPKNDHGDKLYGPKQ